MNAPPSQPALAASGTEMWEVASQNLVKQAGWEWCLHRDCAGSQPVLHVADDAVGEQPQEFARRSCCPWLRESTVALFTPLCPAAQESLGLLTGGTTTEFPVTDC